MGSLNGRSTTNNSAYYPVKDGIKLVNNRNNAANGPFGHNSAMSKFTASYNAEGGTAFAQ